MVEGEEDGGMKKTRTSAVRTQSSEQFVANVFLHTHGLGVDLEDVGAALLVEGWVAGVVQEVGNEILLEYYWNIIRILLEYY